LPLPGKNEANRKQTYLIFGNFVYSEGNGWDKMPYIDFLRFMKQSWCFTNMDENFDGL